MYVCMYGMGWMGWDWEGCRWWWNERDVSFLLMVFEMNFNCFLFCFMMRVSGLT